MALRGGSPQHTGSAIRRGTESPRRARRPCGPRRSGRLCLSHNRRASLRNAPMPHAWFATRSCREGIPKLVHTPPAPYPCLVIGKARGRIPGRDCRMDETARSLPAKRLHSRFYQALGMGYAWANDILGHACPRGSHGTCMRGRIRARRPVSARWRGDVRPIWRSLNQWAHVLESGRP